MLQAGRPKRRRCDCPPLQYGQHGRSARMVPCTMYVHLPLRLDTAREGSNDPLQVFKNESIHVRYADEDVGHNCGTITFYDGYVASRWTRACRGKVNDAEQAVWTAWARDFRGVVEEGD